MILKSKKPRKYFIILSALLIINTILFFFIPFVCVYEPIIIIRFKNLSLATDIFPEIKTEISRFNLKKDIEQEVLAKQLWTAEIITIKKFINNKLEKTLKKGDVIRIVDQDCCGHDQTQKLRKAFHDKKLLQVFLTPVNTYGIGSLYKGKGVFEINEIKETNNLLSPKQREYYFGYLSITAIGPLGISYIITMSLFNVFPEGSLTYLFVSLLINLIIFIIANMYLLKKIFQRVSLTCFQRIIFSILFAINFYLILAILVDLFIILGYSGLSTLIF